MGKIIKIICLTAMFIIAVSCNTNSEAKNRIETAAEKKEVSNVVELKKVALNIEGMTCEIGCARTIQSKLSKTEGIKLAEVSFDDKKGIVEFDSNKVSEKEIVTVVEQIAGGDLYKVLEITKVE